MNNNVRMLDVTCTKINMVKYKVAPYYYTSGATTFRELVPIGYQLRVSGPSGSKVLAGINKTHLFNQRELLTAGGRQPINNRFGI